MSSQWLPNIRKYSDNPVAQRFNALASQLAQYDAQQTQIESTDLPNAINIDNSIIRYFEDSKVITKPITMRFLVPLEPDLNNLTLWLRFDNWTNVINDKSFFGNNGFIIGGSPLGTNGPDKGYGTTVAFSFDGSQQLIDVLDNPPSLRQINITGSFTNTGGNTGNGSFTIPSSGNIATTSKSFTVGNNSKGFSVATLLYPSTYSPTISGQFRYICSKVDDPDNMFVLYFDTNGLIHFWVYRSDVSYSVVSNSAVPVQGWNWIVATYNTSGNVSSLYLNGVQVQTSTDLPFEQPGSTGDFAHAVTDLFIGSNSGGDGFFQGFMSDFRYYHEKVLNPSEVLNLATNYYTVSTIPFGQVLIVGPGAINPGPSNPLLLSLAFRASSTQYVDLTSNTLLKQGEISNSEVTWSYWFKAGGVPSATGAMFTPGASINHMNTNGTITVQTNYADSTNSSFTSSINYADNKWHHLLHTHSDVTNNTYVYIDGNQLFSNVKNNFLASSGTLHIFMAADNNGSNSPTNPFNGQVADLKIYNVQLTPTEILNLFGGVDVTRGRKANWKIIEGSGTTITDTQNSIVGTLTNGPIWIIDSPPGAV